MKNTLSNFILIYFDPASFLNEFEVVYNKRQIDLSNPLLIFLGTQINEYVPNYKENRQGEKQAIFLFKY